MRGRPRIVPRVITPDTKDWTWVLDRVCPECGFDASGCDARQVAVLSRAIAAEWRELFASGAVGAGRPDESTWSSLEYACHVRDVYRRIDSRVVVMLAESDPVFPNWDQDASAVEDRYEEQDPATVVAELEASAEQVALRFETVTDQQWLRPGRRSDGAAFTVESIARYMVHDLKHHLWDMSNMSAASS